MTCFFPINQCYFIFILKKLIWYDTILIIIIIYTGCSFKVFFLQPQQPLEAKIQHFPKIRFYFQRRIGDLKMIGWKL